MFWKRHRRKSTIPESINVYLRGEVPIVQLPLVEEQWGFYDPKRGRIVIKEDLPEVQKHIVLLHQFLDLTRHMINVNDVKTFTESAPLVMLHLMAEAGLYSGLTAKQVSEYIVAETDREAAGIDA